jgi:hypothetical protein
VHTLIPPSELTLLKAAQISTNCGCSWSENDAPQYSLQSVFHTPFLAESSLNIGKYSR